MKNRPNVLVVCGQNKRRSRTAEYLFKNDSRISIRSVGLSPRSARRISEKDLNWSELVFVMEDSHSSRIKKEYRNMDLPEIEVLQIPDDYEYLEPELMEMLEEKMNSSLEYYYGF